MKIEIKIKGGLDQNWGNWLNNLTITSEGNNTVLTGLVPDKSAFHGILNLIRDLNLKLISAQIIEHKLAE